MFYLEKTGLGPSFKRIFGVEAERFCDKLITAIDKRFVLDVLEFDKWLGKNDPEYDPEECTYKGQQEVSMNDYILERYGEEAVKIIEKLSE